MRSENLLPLAGVRDKSARQQPLGLRTCQGAPQKILEWLQALRQLRLRRNKVQMPRRLARQLQLQPSTLVQVWRQQLLLQGFQLVLPSTLSLTEVAQLAQRELLLAHRQLVLS